MVNKRRLKHVFSLFAAFLFVGSCVLFTTGGMSIVNPAYSAALEAPAREKEDDNEELDELQELAVNLGRVFRHAADQVSPSVVWIEAERRVTMRSPRSRSPFEEFFGPGRSPFEEFFGPRERREQPEREFRQQGLGSGVIIDDEGHILTNYHVVADADNLKVKLADGREFEAEISGTDEATELAIIRIKGSFDDLPVAVLGDSDDLYVGEWVVAIGNPMGLSYTVSTGIVSAKGRSVGLARYENLIQTDAAINPGNSGGPLVNLKGEVVGINTAIISQTGGYMGIGLAIPINMAKTVIEPLIAGETVERGYLGIYGADLTPELAESFGYDSRKGALVNELIPGSPADEAGIEAGDIIVSWDGKAVEDFTQLRLLVADTRPGESVDAEIFRDGETLTLQITVDSLLEHEGRGAGRGNWLDIDVMTVTDEIREQLGNPELYGVVVQNIDRESPAVDEINQGDIIISVDRQTVRNVEEFEALMAGTTPENGVLLRVIDARTGRARFVRVRGR